MFMLLNCLPVFGPVVGDGDGGLPQHAAGLGVDLVHGGGPGLVSPLVLLVNGRVTIFDDSSIPY